MKFIKVFSNSIIFTLLIFISIVKAGDTLYVAHWNLQNLFDTVDDPQKDDEEFLPASKKNWTDERLDIKLHNLARVIRSMNNGKGPDLLGVCEVENQGLLDTMINRYLPDLHYKTAYIESPDNRGIDNGLLYKSNEFTILNLQADTVHLSNDWPTRLILGVNLLINKNEKITVFVNHWPSRSGGKEKSEQNRIQVATTLRNAVNRIFKTEPDAKIFIIGDFNDDPVDISILESLNAHPLKCDSTKADYEINPNKELFNLSYYSFENGEGSFKFKETWNLLDQIIVSGSLITGKEINYICNSFEVYKPDIMVTKSGAFKGAPYPTYGGNKYLGGYSDHFPVFAKFKIIGNKK